MTNVQSYQKYLSSDYPGYQSFLETIIIPIFGQKFEANAGLLQKASNPKLVDRFENIIRTSTDESLKEEAFNSGLQSMIKLGSIELDNTESPLFVYDITIGENKELSKNRKGIQTLIRRMLSKNSGAFMIFHYADKQWEWRFSYCFKGMSDEDSTSAKRFTYLLGPNQACKTAAQRFDKLRKQEGRINLTDIEEAFSVEQLSKDFFKRYKAQYGKFVGYVIGKAYDEKRDQWVDAEGILPNPLFEAFGRDEKKARDYVKKLLGRIVFLHFLQKKGWMGADEEWKHGDSNFMQNLFLKSSPTQQANYLDEVLEPLFADALNTKERESLFFDTKVEGVGNVRIPFLGGGLFERDELDKPDSVFPAKYFDDLFEFFTEYNFTIDENDPSDAEVGIDPEMLGMIFENLLEDNKDKGAFYTPKEIVQYMCRESLIAYLQTDVEDETTKQSFRDFVTEHEVSLLKPADVFKVDKKLREVKICDPAIGSGAFPMGLLRELFACRMAIEGEEEGQTAAEIKKDIIQNSIYGVDIEKGAVDIARLRFWLSLILDEDTPNALPNMDFKIMQGNSLLEQYEGYDLSTILSTKKKKEGAVQMTMFENDVDILRNQLVAIRQEYYKTDDDTQKKDLRESMRQKVQQQIDAQSINVNMGDLDIASNNQFFLWHTWFSEVFDNGGFDIVIGNPPYLRVQGIRDVSPEMVDLYAISYKSATGSFDLYACFAELALNLIKEQGVANYIMPLKWSNASFGKGLRKIISEKKAAAKIINFGAYQVFNASTYTALQWFKPGQKDLLYAELDRDLSTNTELGTYLNSLEDKNMATISNDKLGKDTWSLSVGVVNRLIANIEKQPRRVADLFEKIFQGLATGKDDVYFIKDCIKEGNNIQGYSKMLDEKVMLESELCHPLLKGEDVHRYVGVLTSRYVVLPYDEYSNLLSEDVLSKSYPKCYDYFKRCETKLRAREKGRFI